MKRLKGPSGQIADENKKAGDAGDKVVRHAILVHSGPNGEEVIFESGDGEIKFDDDRIQRIVDNHNAKINSLAAQYGGLDKMPIGAFPPILDQHETDSADRIIGRLASLLKFEKRNVPGVGENVACAMADITFMGADTVQKVNDGRLYHLSIGINEETDTLGETSTVIEPAAPGAMLLSGKKGTIKKGNVMKDKKRLKAHASRLAKITAIQTELTGLTKKTVGTKELVTLAGRKREITHRLKNLMAEFRMSPAAYKTLDLTKLAKMDDDQLDTILKAFEANPKIETGQRGTSDAVEFAEIGRNLEKRQQKRLKAEIKADFRKMSGKKMSAEEKEEHEKEMGGGNHEEPVHPGKDPHSVPGQAGDEQQLAKEHAMCMKHLAEAVEKGDMDEVKKAHAALAAHCEKYGDKHLSAEGDSVAHGDVKSEDEKKSQEALQGQVDELNTNLARLAGMVSELMDAEKDEGHELDSSEGVTSEGDEEQLKQRLAEATDEDEKKELKAELSKLQKAKKQAS
jgi:hypothetical protein